MKPKGWRGESGRHRKAARGIKTGRKIKLVNPVAWGPGMDIIIKGRMKNQEQQKNYGMAYFENPQERARMIINLEEGERESKSAYWKKLDSKITDKLADTMSQKRASMLMRDIGMMRELGFISDKDSREAGRNIVDEKDVDFSKIVKERFDVMPLEKEGGKKSFGMGFFDDPKERRRMIIDLKTKEKMSRSNYFGEGGFQSERALKGKLTGSLSTLANLGLIDKKDAKAARKQVIMEKDIDFNKIVKHRFGEPEKKSYGSDPLSQREIRKKAFGAVKKETLAVTQEKMLERITGKQKFKLIKDQDTFPIIKKGETVELTKEMGPINPLTRRQIMKMKDPVQVKKPGVGKFWVEVDEIIEKR